LAIKPKKEHFDSDAVIEAMKKDKKRTGNELALVMMNDHFENLRVNDLKPSEVEQAIAESLRYYDEINL
jgi:3-dehydroquinate synthetase